MSERDQHSNSASAAKEALVKASEKSKTLPRGPSALACRPPLALDPSPVLAGSDLVRPVLRKRSPPVIVGALILWVGLLAGARAEIYFQKLVTKFRLDSPNIPKEVLVAAHPTAWKGERGPVPGLKVFARQPDGAVWLGGDQGAARWDPDATNPWARWQYFYGRRWLADNQVQQIVLGSAAAGTRVWIRTRTGVSRIDFQPMHLEGKAARFEERIERRHVRHGLVASSELRVAGDLSTNQKVSSDNDGLWTAIYLGAEAYRYAVTGSEEARQHARRALHALMRLESITGIPGFYARSFVSRQEPLPADGEWHPTPDGKWLWKGDTSSDESVGHYFAYGLYFDLVASSAEKSAIRAVVSRITDYLIRHDYDMPDVDGRPTRWGQWSERYFATEEGHYESALRSLELLSFLQTAYHVTGDPQYEAAYQDRIQHGYAKLLEHYRRWPGGGEINFSDDELAYLSFLPLLHYETNPDLRAVYLDELRFTWSQVRSDRNPLWNFISVACGAGPMTETILEESRRTLERIPMDLIDWRVTNSQRQDIVWQAEPDRSGRRQMKAVLAPDEQPIHKWNSNPYQPDGGSGGRAEDDGSFFLLPYWMGRYYGWLE